MRILLRLTVCSLLLAFTASQAMAQCEVPDNGTGTVNLPPAGCDYLSPQEVHAIIDGLPPGTEIHFAPIHNRFFNVVVTPDTLGVGGENESFESTLQLDMTGTGDLASFQRSISMQVNCQVHSNARTPGDPVQSFDTEMVQLQGAIFGDPDFDTLTISAGSNFGLPSPGHTTLTRLGSLPGSNWQVDSFFDITYKIDYVGAPGGALSGITGSTTGTVRMEVPQPHPPTNQNVPIGSPWVLALLGLTIVAAGGWIVRKRLVA